MEKALPVALFCFQGNVTLTPITYAIETQTLAERVKAAKPGIAKEFLDYKQQAFIEFILEKYVEDGVGELAPNKMPDLIELKYNTLSDATAELGPPAVIRETFFRFQRHLYDVHSLDPVIDMRGSA